MARAYTKLGVAVAVFSAFKLRLAINTERCDRARLQARLSNLIATAFTLTKTTFINPTKCLFDFDHEHALTIADFQLYSLVSLNTCDVSPVSVHFIIMRDLVHSLFHFSGEIIKLASKSLTKVFKFSLVHKPVTFNPVRCVSKDSPLYGLLAALGTIVVMGAMPALALDFQSSRTLSLAQGGRGGALLNDTIYLNPSLLGFQPVSAFSGTFNWADGSRYAADDTQRTYNASVIDGKNQYVNAGLSFTRRPDLDFIHVALAKRVIPTLSTGLSVKRFTTRQGAKALLSGAGTDVSGFETGLSASVALPPEVSSFPIQIGMTADNLLNRARDEKHVGPRQLGAGVKVSLEKVLMVYGDIIENFSNFSGAYMQWAGGAEVAIGGGFFGRGGLLGGKYQKGLGYGGGWVGPKIGVSYGYQDRLVFAERNYQHAVTVDIFM